MAVSYEKYRRLLKEKHLTSRCLGSELYIAPNTMTRLMHDVEVSLSVLGKICQAWDVNFGDLVDYVDDGAPSERNPAYHFDGYNASSVSETRQWEFI